MIASNIEPLMLDEDRLLPRNISERLFALFDILDDARNRRIHRMLNDQLCRRDANCLKIWKERDSSIESLAEKISDILMKHLSWPNSLFIPKDPFDLILRSPWGDLEIEESVIEIEETAGVKLQDKQWYELTKCSDVHVLTALKECASAQHIHATDG